MAMPAGSGHGSGAITRMIPLQSIDNNSSSNVSNTREGGDGGSPQRNEPVRRAVPTGRIQPLAPPSVLSSSSHLPALPPAFGGSPLTRYRAPLGVTTSSSTLTASSSSSSSSSRSTIVNGIRKL
jgi:hypothetical protein